jgi:hypothetical protein
MASLVNAFLNGCLAHVGWLDFFLVKALSAVITSATKKFRAKLRLCLVDPLSARSLQTFMALAAPRIRAGFSGFVAE